MKNNKTQSFLSILLTIALPITIQNFISASLTTVDTIMISPLGKENLAAVSLGNQFAFVYMLFLFGLLSGAGIFISQFKGKNDVKSIRKVMGISLSSSLLLALIFTIAAAFFSKQIISIYSTDKEVIRLGGDFLKTLSISFIFYAISTLYSFSSRSIGEAKMPMVISVISLLINTVLNYFFLYGKYGLPSLGVHGTALATVIARIFEGTMMVTIIYKNKGPLAASLKELFNFDFDFLKKFFKTTIPVILNEGFWALGTTSYSIFYGRLGTIAVAAVQISMTVQGLFITLIFGVANACATMIGQKIGQNDEKCAELYASRFAKLCTGIGLFLGIPMYIFSPQILKLFSAPPEVYEVATKVMIVLVLFLAVKAYNIALIVGILRGGGDTKFSFYLEAFTIWFVGVPLAAFGSLVLKLPVYYVIALVSLEEVIKCLIGFYRVYSKKWIKNLVEHL